MDETKKEGTSIAPAVQYTAGRESTTEGGNVQNRQEQLSLVPYLNFIKAQLHYRADIFLQLGRKC